MIIFLIKERFLCFHITGDRISHECFNKIENEVIVYRNPSNVDAAAQQHLP
ncbi:MAG: hypothetical protein WHU56_07340 [Thermodesulfovibrio sp.]